MPNNNLYLKKDEFEDVFKKHIKTTVYSMSIKTLFGERMTRKINYSPYYQRNYVWDNSKASFLIESILLGTDVPPLIFFNTGSKYEVIDGRQRFETIMKFRNGDIKLNIKGLSKLTQLRNQTFSKLDPEIQYLLDDAKIRIFEFEVFNEPRLDSALEDKIKKEIFRRYNSGITPLNTAEIDNAMYDDDSVTNKLKDLISNNKNFFEEVGEYFLGKQAGSSKDSSKLLQFLRRYLVLSSFPINSFATGGNRTEIMDLLYNVKSNNTENSEELCEFLVNNLMTTLKLIKSLDVSNNKLVNETLLWGIYILLEEDVDVSKLCEKKTIESINKYLKDNADNFKSESSHHYKAIITRHKSVSTILGKLFDFDYSLFIRSDDFSSEVKDMRQSEKEAKLKLSELSSLRVQKPDASLMPIFDITAELCSNKYLIRPSYQRQEKINIYKASAIIESIILGINLPPLFIYKNKQNVKEVIDGQQRLLSILGFLGKQYQDESGKVVYPKNVNFKLKRLKILSEFDGKRYSDLDLITQDKILDFKLSVIEIDSAINHNFDPVDLFIRLNNKPYPIKDNSFEMWNSFMDRDIIEKIKQVTEYNVNWFFIKRRNPKNLSDRMLNEELITLLSYICYNTHNRHDYTSIGFYPRDNKVNKVNCRITDKKDVSSLLEKISTDIELKTDFSKCVDEVINIIGILKEKLNDEDYGSSLNHLLNRDTNHRYLVDFYMLFQIMQRLNKQRLKTITFDELQSKMSEVQNEIKAPSHLKSDQSPQEYFENLLDTISI